MTAKDIVDSYVTEVAEKLPRKLRNDVAFELQSLINDGLRERAEVTGRRIDAAMATEFLNSFGQPSEVADRYRPSLTIIDPVDGRAFQRATVIGLAVIWALGLLAQLLEPAHTRGGLLSSLGHWWTGTVIPSLWWPGVLVVWFSAVAWSRRRRPLSGSWKPRETESIEGGRFLLLMAVAAIALGLFVLVRPHWLLDVVWNGRAAPSAYAALTYADTFLQRQAPWLFGLLLLNIPVFLVVIAKGSWSRTLRRIQDGLAVMTCAVMAWTLADGPVFETQVTDQTAKSIAAIILALMVFDIGLKLYRRVRPSPSFST